MTNFVKIPENVLKALIAQIEEYSDNEYVIDWRDDSCYKLKDIKKYLNHPITNQECATNEPNSN